MCNSKDISATDGLDDYFRHSVEQGTSVMAIDTANNNKIVGVRAHRVEKRGEREKSQEEEKEDKKDDVPAKDKAAEACAALLRLVDFAYDRFNPWEKLDVDQLLYFKFLIVHRDYRGRNIGVKMTDFTFDFMRREKIPVAYVLATSAYSKAVFKKTGFVVVDEMAYEDYKEDGKVVFCPEPREVHTGFATCVKWVN